MAKLSIEEFITQTLNDTRATILQNMAAKNVNASGRTAAAIVVEQTAPSSWRLVKKAGNNAPLMTLEVGRPAGAVPRGFYYIIKQWTRDKGLAFATERERGTFSYFVARKIAREGTRRNKQNIDIFTTATKEARKLIRKNLGAIVRATLVNDVKK